MKVAIDASRSVDGRHKTGVEVVSDQLLRAMVASTPASVELRCYAPSRISWLPEAVQRIVPGHRLWTLRHLSLALRRDRPDALLVPVHTLPLWLPRRVVRLIHDVSFFRAPEAYAWRERAYMRFDLWRSRRRCAAIIVPTQAVKEDVVRLAGFDPARVVVTGWGAGEVPQSVEHGDRQPIVLFIGRIEEKKNVANLVRAFGEFRKTHPEWRLVLAGKPGHGYERIEPLLREPGVETRGYVTDEEKWRLLRRASVLALVSKEEGFGFPLLEAFQADVPVVASDIPVLREIGGDACVYAPPQDVGGIAVALAQVADEPALRDRLVATGRERLPRYRWDAVAAAVWRCVMG